MDRMKEQSYLILKRLKTEQFFKCLELKFKMNLLNQRLLHLNKQFTARNGSLKPFRNFMSNFSFSTAEQVKSSIRVNQFNTGIFINPHF